MLNWEFENFIFGETLKKNVEEFDSKEFTL